MLFQEIVGQDKLKKQLIKTVNDGRISHAQLFLGRSGTGTLPMAIAYSQFINCTNKQMNDSCGVCPSCLKMNKLTHPDVHFSYPFNTNDKIKSKALSKDFIIEWREIVLEKRYFNLTDWHQKINLEIKQSLINVAESQEIIKKMTLKPYEAEYKTMIIWQPEKMNTEASNKLLKLIEEPYGKTIIILISEDEEMLLKTITSRTQKITFPFIEELEIANALINNNKVDTEKAGQVAAQSEGDFLVALSRINQSAEQEWFFEMFVSWMRGCYEANIPKMNAWVEKMSDRKVGRERQKRFLEYALEVMREGLLRNYVGQDLQRFQGAEGGFLLKFAPFVHENNVFGIMELLNEAHYDVGRNAYAKILFMDMSMRFANLLRVKKRTFVS